MVRRKTKEEFVNKANKVHNFKYDYSLFKYVNNSTKGIIICPIHKEFKQTAANHLRKQGCADCGKIEYKRKRRHSLEKFVYQANIKHNFKYNYSLFVYETARIKGIIICPIHGEFSQVPYSHLAGNGCPRCCKNFKKTKKEFVNQANIKHNFKYDYSLFKYVNDGTKGTIICPIHGKFKKDPEHHLRGEGCKKCSHDKLREQFSKSYEEFIEQSNKIHNFKYDYSLFKYVNDKTKGIIICPNHGKFKQTAGSHIRGRSCKKCSNNVSKISQRWLDMLGVPEKYREVRIKIGKKTFKVDGYDPVNKIIYEFYGDYWHGNPRIFDKNAINPVCKKTYGELYNKTLKRENILKAAGYKVVFIWESDFSFVHSESIPYCSLLSS